MSELGQREEAGAFECGLHSRLHAVEVVLERLVGLGAELRVVDRRDEAAPVHLQSEAREESGGVSETRGCGGEALEAERQSTSCAAPAPSRESVYWSAYGEAKSI